MQHQGRLIDAADKQFGIRGSASEYGPKRVRSYIRIDMLKRYRARNGDVDIG